LSTLSRFSAAFTAAIQSGIDFGNLRSHLEEGVGRLVAHPRFRPDAHVWLSGSGDSLFAAQTALPALERWAGFRGSVATAIEFARYRVPLLGNQDCLWAISNSGSAARTRETVGLANAAGVFTVGITGSTSGPLAAAAATYIYRPVEELADVAQVSRGIFMNMNEFLVTLYTLLFVGLQLGVKRGALTGETAESKIAAAEAAIQSVPRIAAAIESKAEELARAIHGVDTFWIIGAGPAFGTARYCAAKFHEQLPRNAIPEDLEEWAHLQYFLTLTWKERSLVMVLAPPGHSLDRAEELVEGIADAGGRAIVVANSGFGHFPRALTEFRIDTANDEFLTPFTYHLPAQLLILYASLMGGVEPFALRRADGYRLIRHGVVRDSLLGLK
jgi:glucosamine--fructose-6-phosphate aminotransferase (isomerizing)